MFSVVRSATSARAGLMSRKAVMSSVTAIRTKVSLPDLPYDYNALEPAICSEIMTLHHSKHHNTYVTNYNLQEEQLDEAIHKGDTSKIIGMHFTSTSCEDCFYILYI
ncbi:hypothetical protein SARC_14448 [Sphaeroforma arctica JP610]|uniref:superoxide dismutase n=1 Tax=Sphaeroforma arctica JP610 TaxID=667725 RepID=A0A0L0F8W3_9EUKA|nr:hypothetical protein SARC_14448 [Sphaeroforma arctica JP610]KNC72991.1 hypothetical protein SARC_14448 [Sphaeroforma arctica JP610]|eukprot:XP_014146893.1 hypothetical protein SARC_14448 [Sphaeroforma arctica JP610]